MSKDNIAVVLRVFLGNRTESGRDGCPERVGSKELGRAVLVEDIELGDLEPGVAQQVRDLARQVTASEGPLLDRLEAPLPATHSLVGR